MYCKDLARLYLAIDCYLTFKKIRTEGHAHNL